MVTRPGFHPDTSFNEYPPSLIPSIQAFARNFYITRSFKPEKVGNSEYWAILARPSDDFSTHLNADRELLVVLSHYENFEIRTLEAYEEFFALLEQKRVDRSIGFLVSGDVRIEPIISHYLNQHPEYPVIIPIHLNDLNKSDDTLLGSVRRNYLLRDLFGYQNPLREETFFFGRQDVVNTVLDLAKSGQSSSLFGLRKSGKTSTIFAIQRKAKAFGCSTALIDCQSPLIHARRYSSLLAHVVSEVRKSIGQSKRIESLGEEPVEIATSFQNEMKSALGQAKTGVIVIFDEIENISPATAASDHWRSGEDTLLFWQNMRSFIQTESKGRLSLCIVGTSPLLLEEPEIQNVANPMYLFSQKRFIPRFTFDETREMIQQLGYFMGLEFDAVLIARLQELYGGHPFFIRQLCSKIHQLASDHRPVRVNQPLFKKAVEAFSGQLESYLTDILGSLKASYPQEYALLGSIVEHDLKEINEYGRDAPELIDHLIGYGIIEGRGGNFELRFGAVDSAVRRIFSQKDGGERWSEISKRRNDLETSIRRELFHWAKSVDASIWASVLREGLTKRRFEALESLEPRVIFSKSESPLYWTDLIGLLKLASVLPYLHERRAEIVQHMYCVNDLRKDAHAMAVSDEEMDTVRKAFDFLEQEFLEP